MNNLTRIVIVIFNTTQNLFTQFFAQIYCAKNWVNRFFFLEEVNKNDNQKEAE